MQSENAATSVSTGQNDENTVVSENDGLSELELSLMESVKAGVPEVGTPAYFEYFTSERPSTCVPLLMLSKLVF